MQGPRIKLTRRSEIILNGRPVSFDEMSAELRKRYLVRMWEIHNNVYNVEKMLREHGDKISGSERGDVENAVADAKKALESDDKQQMDQARERLTQASHKLAEQMYRAAQPQGAQGGVPGASAGPAPGGDGQAKKDEGVVDAEYVDVDDRKSA